MSKGFIKVEIAMFDLDFWQSKRVYSKTEALLDLLQRATFHETVVSTKQGTMRIEKNQVVCSAISLARDWNWDVDAAKEYVHYLQTMRVLNISKHNNVGILTMHMQHISPLPN